MSRARRGCLAASLLLAASVLASCGGAAGAEHRAVTVLAAASLTDVFQDLKPRFEQAHPDVELRFNFAGSSTLAEQVIAGAPADVFASANTATMQRVVDEDLVDGQPELFATNVLTIAVPTGNPGNVRSFADLGNPELDLVICAPQVPCGAAASRVQQLTGTTLSPDSEENDVRSVLAKVQAGEADAGLVYRTDVASAGDSVERIGFPEAQQAVNEYQVAALTDAPQPEAAASFVAFVRGDEGKAALRRAGFGTP